ncbi:hypothetical protein JW868_04790 [Candidatus Woesearchaeota archaeon]|nr:hypothetical protein [Candidatus Woesearchaeota archaeon]
MGSEHGKCIGVQSMNKKLVLKIVPDGRWFTKLNSIFNLHKRFDLEYSIKPEHFKEYTYWLALDKIIDIKVGNCWCYIFFGHKTMHIMITKSGGYERILEKVWKKFPMKEQV